MTTPSPDLLEEPKIPKVPSHKSLTKTQSFDFGQSGAIVPNGTPEPSELRLFSRFT